MIIKSALYQLGTTLHFILNSVSLTKQTSNTSEDPMAVILVNLFLYIGAFVLVVILAFYFSRFIAKKTSVYSKGKHIQILESVALDKSNRIAIVQVYKKIYLVSFNSNAMCLLDNFEELDEENELTIPKPEDKNFQQILNRFFHTFKTQETKDSNDKDTRKISNKLVKVKQRVLQMQRRESQTLFNDKDEEDETSQ